MSAELELVLAAITANVTIPLAERRFLRRFAVQSAIGGSQMAALSSAAPTQDCATVPSTLTTDALLREREGAMQAAAVALGIQSPTLGRVARELKVRGHRGLIKQLNAAFGRRNVAAHPGALARRISEALAVAPTDDVADANDTDGDPDGASDGVPDGISDTNPDGISNMADGMVEIDWAAQHTAAIGHPPANASQLRAYAFHSPTCFDISSEHGDDSTLGPSASCGDAPPGLGSSSGTTATDGTDGVTDGVPDGVPNWVARSDADGGDDGFSDVAPDGRPPRLGSARPTSFVGAGHCGNNEAGDVGVRGAGLASPSPMHGVMNCHDSAADGMGDIDWAAQYAAAIGHPPADASQLRAYVTNNGGSLPFAKARELLSVYLQHDIGGQADQWPAGARADDGATDGGTDGGTDDGRNNDLEEGRGRQWLVAPSGADGLTADGAATPTPPPPPPTGPGSDYGSTLTMSEAGVQYDYQGYGYDCMDVGSAVQDLLSRVAMLERQVGGITTTLGTSVNDLAGKARGNVEAYSNYDAFVTVSKAANDTFCRGSSSDASSCPTGKARSNVEAGNNYSAFVTVDQAANDASWFDSFREPGPNAGDDDVLPSAPAGEDVAMDKTAHGAFCGGSSSDGGTPDMQKGSIDNNCPRYIGSITQSLFIALDDYDYLVRPDSRFIHSNDDEMLQAHIHRFLRDHLGHESGISILSRRISKWLGIMPANTIRNAITVFRTCVTKCKRATPVIATLRVLCRGVNTAVAHRDYERRCVFGCRYRHDIQEHWPFCKMFRDALARVIRVLRPVFTFSHEPAPQRRHEQQQTEHRCQQHQF